MKFWVSLVLGVVVLTVVGTVMIVLNPGMKAPQPASATVAPNPTGPQPRVVVTDTSRQFDNVAQGIVDQATFVVENQGEGELQLTPYFPRCTCSALEVRQSKPEETDFIKLTAVDKKWQVSRSDGSPGYVSIPPGGSAEVVVQWDTTNRLGKYSVAGELKTNDLAQPQLQFIINLNVKQDVMYHEDKLVDFGTLRQGESTERTLIVYSSIRDDLQITDISTSTASLTAEIRPLPPEDAQKLQAKSGNVVAVISDGTLPEGHFRHEVTLTYNLNPKQPESIPVHGTVKGKMELLPSVVDFHVAAAGQAHVVEVKVFAHGLPPERTLKVAELTPAFLKAEIKRSDEFPTLWILTVHLDASAPAGKFEGNLSIVDEMGVKRLNIPTKGVVSGSTSGSVTQR